jgi:hypothetical protein
MPKSRRLMLALSVALLIGVGGPAVDVAIKCQRSQELIAAACPETDAAQSAPCPASTEACVWGKALLPVSIGVGLLVLGLPAALLVYWWTGRSRFVEQHDSPRASRAPEQT